MKKKAYHICENIKNAMLLIYEITGEKLALTVALAILTGIIPVIVLWINQGIINNMQTCDIPLKSLIGRICVLFIITVVGTMIGSLYQYSLNDIQNRISYGINHKIMDKSSKLSLRDFEKNETYDQINRLEQNVTIKPYQALQAIIDFITSLFTIGSASCIIASQNVCILFLILLISTILAICEIRVGKKEYQIHYDRSEAERKAWYITYLLTHDTCFKEIKTNGISDYFLGKYRNYVNTFIDQENSINRLRVLLLFFVSFVQDFLTGILMVIITIRAYRGNILLGTALTFLSTVTLVQKSTNNCAQQIYSLHNASIYLSTFFDFLSLNEENDDGTEIETLDNLSLQNVSFDYIAKKNAVRKIDIIVNKGDQIAIVGKNGSGKSTLFKILAGLYIPKGEFKVNGIERNKIRNDSYRMRITAMFQDFMKYEGSLRDNILIGDIYKDYENKKIEKALQSANVNFLNENGEYLLEQNIGSWFKNGKQLSGGQWQKIALARAYYKEADMYMLDEPSAALDVIAEKKIFETFFDISKGKIGIFITHRVKIAQLSPRILVMDEGRIIAEGNHDFLYKNCRLYKEMYDEEE